MSTKERIYEPPVARDLSAFSADGQEVKPLGMCIPGTSPVSEWCSPGDEISQPEASCFPNGVVPSYGGCSDGLHVAADCTSGGAPIG